MYEEKCQPGSYAPILKLGNCLPCPPGKTCPNFGTYDPLSCPTGHYCELGISSVSGTPCPSGTYNPYFNKTSFSDCLPCPSGKFCFYPGLSTPSGNCTAGFFCKSGAKSASPNDTVNMLCPVGRYCENGTINPEQCPPGTLRKFPGGTSVKSCYPCDPGNYCEISGLTSPTGLCDQGFFCPDNASASVKQPTSYKCPPGYYCPKGTSVPIGCLPGTYQPSNGGWDCLSCPAGKYCSGNTILPDSCPPYHYCPEGTVAPLSCPNGTYTMDSVRGLSSNDSCNPCPSGRFCQNGIPVGNCSGGYICFNGSMIPNPTDGIQGIICPVGYYCPPGTEIKIQCPKGLVIYQNGSSSINDCQQCPAGYICVPESTVPALCNRGYFCPFNLTRTPCREGTYNNLEGAIDESWCRACPPGYWCKETGITCFNTIVISYIDLCWQS